MTDPNDDAILVGVLRRLINEGCWTSDRQLRGKNPLIGIDGSVHDLTAEECDALLRLFASMDESG